MDNEKSSKGNQKKALFLIAAVVVLGAALYLLTDWLVWRGKTFSQGSMINGVDVSGLTASQACEAIEDAAADYTLTVAFCDGEQTLTAQDLGLSVEKKRLVRQALKRQHQGDASGSAPQYFSFDDLYQMDGDAICQTVTGWSERTTYADQTAVDAKLVYQEAEGVFAVEPEQPGGTVDPEALTEQVQQCAAVLAPRLDVLEAGLYGDIRTSTQAEVQTALEKANAQLNLTITYEYHVEGDSGETIEGTETIGRDLLSQWLYVDEDGLSVEVDSDALQNYVTLMHDTYSIQGGSTSQFVTTDGDYVTVNVPAADETVDTDALYHDILAAVDGLEEGTRQAPYASTSVGISGTTDLGGNYVEIDLDKQHLWLYREGTLVADGDICSGDVATGCATPGGLYTINSMETDRWLNGPTWHDWVSYWMPFNGGIGLHDATWRSAEEFGGEVYLESGSHGCINMPLELAKQVYEQVDVGFYVILYGGEQSDQNQPQTITGTSYYAKETGDDPFYLDAKATGDGTLTYSSSDESVVQVDADGKVTIIGGGEAVIRVVAPATERYMEAVKEITIAVSGPPKREETSANTDQKPSSDGNQSQSTGDSQQGETTKPEKPSTKPSKPESSKPEQPEEETPPADEGDSDAPEETPQPEEPDEPEPQPGDGSEGEQGGSENTPPAPDVSTPVDGGDTSSPL